jgi:hypothetical protein
MPDDPRIQDISAEIKNVLHFEVINNFDTLNLIDSVLPQID